jgi:hypothetical protein
VPLLLLFSLNVFSFIKNEGQFKDQNGEEVKELLFQYSGENIFISLNNNGFSYEIRELKSENQNPLEEKKSFEFAFNRCDVIFQEHNEDFEVITDKGHYLGALYRGVERNYRLNEYKRVLYRNVYNNIDIEFLITSKGFKYNFILYPGAKISDIKLFYDSPFQMNSTSETIEIISPLGEIQETIPLSYVLGLNGKLELDVNYTSLDKKMIGFETDYVLKEKDTLVIDPVPNRNFGTYIGGTMEDFANAICNDELGNLYVAGQTRSLNAIATTGAHQGTLVSFFDAYIAKFNSSGTKLWGTYFGGDAYDRGLAIEYRNGNLFLAGNTLSTNMATTGAHQENTVDGDEAFLARFDNNGQLIWSTYYGGELHDFIDDICFDSQNNVYITGHTSSTFNIATTGAHIEIFTGISAAFLAKFDVSGNLIWGTYYGDSFDEGIGVAADNNDNIYITGLTYSTSGIATSGVHQELNGGAVDAFLAKFDSNGTLEWGTYYGGAQDDIAHAITVTDSNRIYITGDTQSSSGIHFNQGYQNSIGNTNDGFIAKFSNQGNIIWSSYAGGEDDDFIYGIDHFNNEDILLTGVTRSVTNISTPEVFQNNFSGFYDAFILKISGDGQMEWGTYYGGVGFDEAKDILIDQNQSTFSMIGNTASTNDISSVNSDQEFSGGDDDAILVQFCDPIIPQLNYAGATELCYTDEIYISTDSSLFDSYIWSDGSNNFDLDLTGVTPGSYQFYLETIDTNGCAGNSDTIDITVHQFTPISFTPNQTLYCAGDTIDINVNNDYISYAWSTGAAVDSILIPDAQEGSYSFFIDTENNAGCTYSDTISIDVYATPQPSINVNGSANFCNNETVDVDLNTSYASYNWFNGSNSSSVTLSSEELVWVEVTNSFGCTGMSDSIFVDSDVFTPLITLSNASNPICLGDSVSLALNNSYDTYLWSNGVSDSVLILDTQNLGVGTYSYTVEVANNCGGNAVSTPFEIEIVEVIEPTINIDFVNPNCLEDTVKLWVDSPYVQYLLNNTITDSVQSINTSDLGAGSYYYSVDVVHECGANLTSDSVLLEIVDPVDPEITLLNSNEVICIGEELEFEIDLNFYSIQWSIGGNSPSVTEVVTTNGNHIVFVNTIDQNGCEGYDEYDYFVDSCELSLPSDFNLEGEISIYPNPAKEKISFYSDNSYSVQHIMSILIVDLEGNLVCQIDDFYNMNNQIDVKHLATGVYRVVLMDKFLRNIGTLKFIKI